MRTRLTIALLWAALSAGAVAQTSPSSQSSGDQPRPTFRTEANFVRVDLYAMRDGRAVEDLRQDELDVLEDGVRQEVVAFEHVKVRPAGPQDTRVEPGTVRESRDMAADSRARVFVIFLDTYHTQIEGSQKMRQPLVNFLDRVIGQDDLVAVMTPEMSAANVTFGRKTTLISAMMQKEWAWGRRDRIAVKDPQEERYEICYPPNDSDQADVSREMIARRREKLTLDALEDLVVHLGGLREERKAVLTVSEGWMQYGENPALARKVGNRVPGPPGIFVGRGGKIQQTDPREPGGASLGDCDADRVALANLDNRFRVVRLAEQANRANVTFYPVYPRGLSPFDSSIGPAVPPTPMADQKNLNSRLDSLRTLGSSTDGLSVINTNDIEGGMRRIVEDLSSYYLLGYYSTNNKLDGRFRSITVKVKRTGVDVRARRGYRGRTAEELSRLAPAAADKTAVPPPAVSTAMANISSVSSRSLVRLRAAAWATSAGTDKTAAAVWLVGELDPSLHKQAAWATGGKAELTIVAGSGETVISRTIDLEAAAGAFSVRLPDRGGLAPGEYAVRVQIRPKQDGSLPVGEIARVIVPAQPARLGEAVLWRRGPTTGLRFLITADPRFLRNERIKLEHATTGAGGASARMLDRNGNLLQVPVTLSERQDESGEFRWLAADATLAPLAPGDYAIEVALDDGKFVTGFKVVP